MEGGGGILFLYRASGTPGRESRTLVEAELEVFPTLPIERPARDFTPTVTGWGQTLVRRPYPREVVPLGIEQ